MAVESRRPRGASLCSGAAAAGSQGEAGSAGGLQRPAAFQGGISQRADNLAGLVVILRQVVQLPCSVLMLH